MTGFVIHSLETAPEASTGILSELSKGWGFIPNLHGILAESPEALAGYHTLFGLVGKTSLSPIEQQVAFLAVSFVNECSYCMAGHSALAAMAKVPAPVIAALRAGTEVPDAKLDALARFVRSVTTHRGSVGDEAVAAFLAAGFSRRAVLDVVLVVATKTLSNYTNHLTHTPDDAFMAATAWTPPATITVEG
ncbi:MAG: carboxymuconolactone decarboxylase family protein [Alphaproteobacteria bacterium]|nr:carboxymuconolactone decarboxylase family protein [Alphaproteobacteria bacterium]TAD89974.1 MAG: carboxymuconolactone decarboxylase family protein [Alphaproteobacteria bacterium]